MCFGEIEMNFMSLVKLDMQLNVPHLIQFEFSVMTIMYHSSTMKID